MQPQQPTTSTTLTTGSTEFWFDGEAAKRAVSFFPRFLKHIKGEWAGQPVTLEPWQAEIISKVFGWKRSSDDTRKYRTVYIEIPRKNGKSTLCSGLAALLLCGDKEPGAEVYSAAADRDQAAIVFEAAKQMIQGSPDLAAISETYRRSIIVPRSASTYKVLSADAHTKHGLNASGIIFDELHTQPNRDLWDVLTTSTAARRQPLVIAITTAGYDRNSICYELHDYACKIRDGIIQDDSFLPVIFAADEKADWTNPKTWAACNPTYPISPKHDYLEQECRKAQEIPAYENTFKRLQLNIWTEQAIRWMPMHIWNGCAAAYEEDSLEKQECYAGLDLASKTDIAALELLFPATAERPARVLSYFWCPGDNIKRRSDRDRVPYKMWTDQGHMMATEGNVIDFDAIRQKINELGNKFIFKQIGYDPWNATQLANQLAGDGFEMVEVRQGFQSLCEPTKELMNLAVGQQIQHNDNPVMNWMAANVTVKQDPAGNLKPDKSKSTGRIDGMVALIMALSGLVRSEDDTSIYETQGLDIFDPLERKFL